MNGLTSLFWFIAVIAAIPLVLWFVKRSPIGSVAGAGLLRHVATLPLSASQRIVTVEVGSGDERRWLVLGVTPTAITTLHTMTPQHVEPAPGAQPPASFAQMFSRLRGPAPGDDGAR